LVCAVEREEEVIIPNGSFVLKEGDSISIVASPKNANEFFKKIGMESQAIRSIMIIGGGETAYYLAQLLIPLGIHVKIIEKDKERCKTLSEYLPQSMIICGDGMDTGLLEEEGLSGIHAFVSWTDMDEENFLLSLYARHNSKAKVITRIHRIGYEEIVAGMDLGSVFFPEFITAEYIIRYVRGMHASIGSNMESMYRLMNNQVEALEFYIKEVTDVVGISLIDLKLKRNLLLCSINRGGRIIIPGGQDTIEVGDSVVVVTTNTGFSDITDILL
jgi:trk system potassium uptake protein TrkA